MKQYTTPEQTDKLIELGFEKPTMKNILTLEGEVNEEWYSIGELIKMLPKEIDCELGDLGLSIENNIYEQPNEWIVSYDSRHQTNSIELIDALYNMILELNEEGII